MERYLLGIDIGTSGCKAAVFYRDGRTAAQSSCKYKTDRPRPGYAQQNPEDWWKSAITAVRQCIQKAGIHASSIAGIGVDGQSWGAVALDKDGNVLCPSPIWLDTRAEKLCIEYEEKIGAHKILEKSGNKLRAFYGTGKVLWYQKNRPEIYKKIYKIL